MEVLLLQLMVIIFQTILWTTPYVLVTLIVWLKVQVKLKLFAEQHQVLLRLIQQTH